MEKPNLSYINELSGGDEAFKNKLITIIKKEFPEEKEVYFKNFKAKNFKASAENVHKLKHKISILGLEKSYKHLLWIMKNNLKGSNSFWIGETDFNLILTMYNGLFRDLIKLHFMNCIIIDDEATARTIIGQLV